MSYFDDHEDSIIYGYSPGLRHEPRRRHTTVKCPDCGEGGLELSYDTTAYLYRPGVGRHYCQARALNDFEDLDQ